ncbi:E3 ubiquitin-protein ligase RMA1H1-like [Amaranthus tricolor]|uniref:E3 ubiquitin-protein ligase RMA1H1-like n=1 Tax=Amaranthus tricolor TaxID=29722 RepID=UPI002585BBF3|nr:E3 ubiquitin-protein ligase RMA1H1-like [Amaranthus tricolor]
MAVEQQFDYKSKSDLVTPKDADNLNGSFECNICLDFANEPVVTLCGHLYCWRCIYKWFLVQSASLSSDEYPQCPVCKAEISHTTVIPLYGRGQSPNNSKDLTQGSGTPPRPPACGTRALLNAASQSRHQLLPFRNPYQPPHVQSSSPPEDQAISSSLFNQTSAVMFGEMVYARVFGNSQRLYAYPNFYTTVGGSSSRLLRQAVHIDKCLSRVSFFLVCCVILCLFFF